MLIVFKYQTRNGDIVATGEFFVTTVGFIFAIVVAIINGGRWKHI